MPQNGLIPETTGLTRDPNTQYTHNKDEYNSLLLKLPTSPGQDGCELRNVRRSGSSGTCSNPLTHTSFNTGLRVAPPSESSAA